MSASATRVKYFNAKIKDISDAVDAVLNDLFCNVHWTDDGWIAHAETAPGIRAALGSRIRVELFKNREIEVFSQSIWPTAFIDPFGVNDDYCKKVLRGVKRRLIEWDAIEDEEDDD